MWSHALLRCGSCKQVTPPALPRRLPLLLQRAPGTHDTTAGVIGTEEGDTTAEAAVVGTQEGDTTVETAVVGTEEGDTTAEAAVAQRTDDIKGTGAQAEQRVAAEGGCLKQ